MEMDANITQFILDVDGQLVKYAHGPVVPMAVQWPGPKGSNQVRVQVSPPSATGSSGSGGGWAVGAVPHARRRRSSRPGDAPEPFFIVTFKIGNRRTRFEVTTNSVQHPIRLKRTARVLVSGRAVRASLTPTAFFVPRSLLLASSVELPGWFGKLPGMGDFAHSAPARTSFARPGIRGCSGLARLRDRHADWTEHYLEAPVWCFALGPRVAGEKG